MDRERRRSPDAFSSRRRRSPEGRSARRSRSPLERRDRDRRRPASPPRRDRADRPERDRVDRDRLDRNRPDRNRDDRRHRSRSPAFRDHDSTTKKVRPPKPAKKIDLESCQGVDEEMQKLMGFGAFDTTKNKKVTGNATGAARINKPRKYRQYMNRKGGFNRPLDYVA